jgi:hypothetical protein
MAARTGNVFVAGGRSVARLPSNGAVRQDELPRPAIGISAATPFTRVRIAVPMEVGAVLFWDDGDSRPFADDMPDPAVAFTRGGMLVALSAGVGRAYRGEGKSLRLHSSFAGYSSGRSPVAVTPTDMLNHFAVFTADGVVRVLQLAP